MAVNWPLCSVSTHVHLTLQWDGVEAINYFWAGPCVASQGQGVHSAA